jgi:hypothetical protein
MEFALSAVIVTAIALALARRAAVRNDDHVAERNHHFTAMKEARDGGYRHRLYVPSAREQSIVYRLRQRRR